MGPDEADLASSLRWRDACDARHLVVNLLVGHVDGLSKVGRFVDTVDAMAAPHRERPTLRVYCLFPESMVSKVRQLADLDARTPRMEVIRVLDGALEPLRLVALAQEATAAETEQLLFWTYLELASTRALGWLAQLLDHDAPGALDLSAIRRFPIVEVPGRFSVADAEPIAALWSRHPQLQEASARSLGGRVDAFFRCFEWARLARIGVELPALTAELGADAARCLPSFCEWLEGSSLMDAEPRAKTAILEHDVDLLADSHECQSPVFKFAGTTANAGDERSLGTPS